ncbi:MAG TPA: hypothetical protein VJ725_30760 [Thermoanaerobaculia bacterium]|nr:hypothetical protein [Thermoanaerobaculia bacterium]
MAVTLALFAGGIVMGLAGALMWAWGVHSGQFRNLEETKQQLFWPELAPETGEGTGPETADARAAAVKGATR